MPDRPDDLVGALEADLSALAAAEADLERDAEVAERTRIERGAVTLADRLRGAGGPVEVTTAGGARHSGRVADTGDGWVLLELALVSPHGVTAQHLVALASVVSVRGLGRAAAPDGRRRRATLASVLRAWCRDRSEVTVLTHDGGQVSGLASATYADHLELSTGAGSVVVPFLAIAVASR